jgi:hypothetical protein
MRGNEGEVRVTEESVRTMKRTDRSKRTLSEAEEEEDVVERCLESSVVHATIARSQLGVEVLGCREDAIQYQRAGSRPLFRVSAQLGARALTHHLGRLVLPLVDEDLERLRYALRKARVCREALLDDLQRGLPKSDEAVDHLVVGGGVEDDGETSGLRDGDEQWSVSVGNRRK